MARISGKDLAAIAALGVAGTMAYRDYNKKKEAKAETETKDNAREVAERPSLQTRQEALQKQADMESAGRNFDYIPSDEEGRESSRFKRPVSATRTPAAAAPSVAPTSANANAAVDNAAKERARVDALMVRAGPRSGNITAQRAALLAKGPNYEAAPGGRALTPEESRRLAQNTASPGGYAAPAMKRGGKVSSKPKASSASSRGDGIAQRGKTRGKYL